jgi:hypothetical protein
MQKSELISALEPIIKIFDEFKILYYIGGSIASSAYGAARSTLDVDVITNLLPEHIHILKEKLKNEYYIDEKMIANPIRTKSSFNLVHLESMLKIDFFILKNNPYSFKELERRVKDKIEDETNSINIYLCSPEDIILNKLEWYKLGGEISDRQWTDIIAVIKVQSENLDKDYLIYWSRQLEINNLLVKCFSECKIQI